MAKVCLGEIILCYAPGHLHGWIDPIARLSHVCEVAQSLGHTPDIHTCDNVFELREILWIIPWLCPVHRNGTEA